MLPMPVITLLQNLRQEDTGTKSFKSATEKSTIVQKIVLITYRLSDKIPLTGPGKKLSISYPEVRVKVNFQPQLSGLELRSYSSNRSVSSPMMKVSVFSVQCSGFRVLPDFTDT
jgi:hypothetical protein